MCNFDVMRRGSYFEGEPIRTELEVGEKTQIARHQSMMIGEMMKSSHKLWDLLRMYYACGLQTIQWYSNYVNSLCKSECFIIDCGVRQGCHVSLAFQMYAWMG